MCLCVMNKIDKPFKILIVLLYLIQQSLGVKGVSFDDLLEYEEKRNVTACFGSVDRTLNLICQNGSRISIIRVFYGLKKDDHCPSENDKADRKDLCCSPEQGDCFIIFQNRHLKDVTTECSNRTECSISARRLDVLGKCGESQIVNFKRYTQISVAFYECISGDGVTTTDGGDSSTNGAGDGITTTVDGESSTASGGNRTAYDADDGGGTGAVIGAVVGVLAVVVIVVGVVVFFVLRRRKSPQKPMSRYDGLMGNDKSKNTMKLEENIPSNPTDYSYAQVNKIRSNSEDNTGSTSAVLQNMDQRHHTNKQDKIYSLAKNESPDDYSEVKELGDEPECNKIDQDNYGYSHMPGIEKKNIGRRNDEYSHTVDNIPGHEDHYGYSHTGENPKSSTRDGDTEYTHTPGGAEHIEHDKYGYAHMKT